MIASTAALWGLAGDNIAGALAGAAAPELAYRIGHQSGLSEDDVAARAIAHAILGGAVAAVQGNSAAAGAAGAATGELAAKAIAGVLYPDVTDLSKLNEEQKQTISTLATISAGMAGGLAGDSAGSAVAGGQAGKNAAENNSLSVDQNQDRIKELSQCQGNAGCETGITEKYRQLNAEQRKRIVECKGAQACVDKANEVGDLQTTYANRLGELGDKLHNTGSLTPEEKQEWAYLQAVLPQLEADKNAAIHNALMSGDSDEAKQLAVNSLAQAIGISAASIAAGIGKAGNKTAGARDNRLPIPESTVATNGLKIESNPKHTPGAPGSRPNAGVEPKNSLSLFENSIATRDPKVRLAIDSDGKIHRFFNSSKDGTGAYHWSGSTGDSKNALTNRDLGNFNKEIKELRGKK
ncbi:VENN motif pre-toxin domain-containing protein [Leclercia adecarboxylata]|uniref:VENN motif pre-toxin domain-containing protein n=1 Tax=Leclercia adecarboxylata TaxID=83655 RepID=UPI0013C9B64D|nr:hypothetical protein [Leclercia adecarboxylata]